MSSPEPASDGRIAGTGVAGVTETTAEARDRGAGAGDAPAEMDTCGTGAAGPDAIDRASDEGRMPMSVASTAEAAPRRGAWQDGQVSAESSVGLPHRGQVMFKRMRDARERRAPHESYAMSEQLA